MPQNPSYTIAGNLSYADNAVSFQIGFQNAGDQLLVQTYEWYLDNVLVINAAGQDFAAEISCGRHIISCRLLYQGKWTGTQEFVFKTCATVTSIEISGPDTVDIGESAAYAVIAAFSDGSSEDITGQYIFSASAGGSFEGDIFTATGDGSLTPPFGVTLTATPQEGAPLTKSITINNADTTSMGILVVDLYTNATLNVIGLIDNEEVAGSHQAAYAGNNFVPVESGAAGALILASDFVDQSVLNWRFEFNLNKLRFQYPGTDQFRLFIMGRGAEATTLNGTYVVFNPQGQMTMTGSPGTYVPSVTGGAELIGQTPYTANVVAGANGSYDEEDLTLIIEFIYSVSENTVTYSAN